MTGECRKKTYDTKKEALAEAQWLLETRGECLLAYRCSECGKWHLGTAPKRIGELLREGRMK